MGGCRVSKVRQASVSETPERTPSPTGTSPSPSTQDVRLPPRRARSLSLGEHDSLDVRTRPRVSFAELVGTEKARELDHAFGTLQPPRVKNGRPQVHPWERELHPDRVVIRLDQPEKVNLKEKLDLDSIKQAWTPAPDGTLPKGTTPMLWLVGMNVLIVGPETLVGKDEMTGKEQRKAHASFVGGEKLGRIGGELGWDWADQTFFIVPKSGRYCKGQTDRGLPQLKEVAKVFGRCGVEVEAREYMTLGQHAVNRARKYESPVIAASAKPSPNSPLFLDYTSSKLLENLVDINLDDANTPQAVLCRNRLMTELGGLKQPLVAEMERLSDPRAREQPTPLSNSDSQQMRQAFARAGMPAAHNDYMEVFAGHLMGPLKNAILGWAGDASRRILNDSDPTKALQATLRQVEHLPKELLRLAVPDLLDGEIALQPAARARFVDALYALDTTQAAAGAPSATEVAGWVNADNPGSDAANQALIQAYLADADRRPQEFQAVALAFLCGMIPCVGVPPEQDDQAQALNRPPTKRRTELFDAILERAQTLPVLPKLTLNVCLFQAIEALPPSAQSSALERLTSR